MWGPGLERGKGTHPGRKLSEVCSLLQSQRDQEEAEPLSHPRVVLLTLLPTGVKEVKRNVKEREGEDHLFTILSPSA